MEPCQKLVFLYLSLLLACFHGYAVEPNRVLYLMNRGDIPASLALYEDYKQETGRHDMELIQRLGYSILVQGSISSDPEAQVLAMFGAAISGNEQAVGILKEGLKSQNPQFQLAAINLISKFNSDPAIELINSTLSSPYLPIRLEGVYLLAKNKHPKASGQVEALMQKVPPEVLVAFPELLAICGDRNSIRTLHQMLSHPLENVRIEAIISASKHGRDDLLPDIRRLSTHINATEQEACAIALGRFKDELSASRLERLSNCSSPTVKLASLFALYQLGREEKKAEIEIMAKEEDLFAIDLLGKIPGSEPTLQTLMKSNNLQVRINATLSLLERNCPECLKGLAEILINDRRDLAFVKHHSRGKGLSAWKAVPSARQNFASQPVKLEVSLNFREQVLLKALRLPERDYLQLANLIFSNRQYDLIPAVTHSLIELQSAEGIELLKTYRGMIGSPLIRNYCILALFHLKEPGNYAELLQSWVASHHNHVLIHFRPLVPYETFDPEAPRHQLTPEETSRLLVESFETLVQTQDEGAVDVLLNAIQYGNPKNRFALAGLLIRAAH